MVRRWWGWRKVRQAKIPMEIQKQAVDPDEEMSGAVRGGRLHRRPAVGPWQRQLNELGWVKPLAFGQYGELGAGFEQLLDQLAEGSRGRNGQAVRSAVPNRRSSERSTAPAAAAASGGGSPKYTGGCAPPPGWDAAAERRGAQDELRSAAQARAWADGGFDTDLVGPRLRPWRGGPFGLFGPGTRPQRDGSCQGGKSYVELTALVLPKANSLIGLD
jgi:hypothetical protein